LERFCRRRAHNISNKQEPTNQPSEPTNQPTNQPTTVQYHNKNQSTNNTNIKRTDKVALILSSPLEVYARSFTF